VEDERFKVDLMGQVFCPDVHARSKWIEIDQHQGDDHGEQHDADGDGHPQHTNAQPSEQSGSGHEDADQFESVHTDLIDLKLL
jgi:hypothetical protein